MRELFVEKVIDLAEEFLDNNQRIKLKEINPISLEELKKKFGFVPPQAFSYAETYTELTEHILTAEKVVIINR